MDQGFSANMTSYPPKADLENDTSAEASTHISSPAPRPAANATHGAALPRMLAPVQQRTYPPLLAPETAAAAYLHESASIGTAATASPLNNNPHRYPESSRRSLALHQHHNDHAILSTYASYHSHPTTYLDDLPGDFNAHPGAISRQEHTSGRHRCPMPDATTTTDSAYPADFHTPFSSSNSTLSSPVATYHLPPMGLHLPSPSPLSSLSTEPLEMLNYRGSMRGAYTDLQSQPNDDAYRRPTFQPPLRLSHSVEQQHHPAHQDPSGLYSDTDTTNNQPIAQIASRRRSTADSDLALMDSPPLVQYRHRHQHPTALVYDSSISSAGPGASYPGSSGGSHHSHSHSHLHSQSHTHTYTHLQSQSQSQSYSHSQSQSHTHAPHLYRHAHASSSIPMSNSHAESANNANNANANANHHRRGTNDNHSNHHTNDDHRRGIKTGYEERRDPNHDAAINDDDDDYSSKSNTRCTPQGQSVRAVGYAGYASRSGALDTTIALARFERHYNNEYNTTSMPFASEPLLPKPSVVPASSATHSPLGTSDAGGSDGNGNGLWNEEEDEEEYAWESRYRWESGYQPLQRQQSIGSCAKRKLDLDLEREQGDVGADGAGVVEGVAEGNGNGNANNVEPPLKKKKKKAKMHECAVCAKKFPRPSGLKTHMNTHSNEKPFPCGFPGCTRTFGVRSNAKRHLRTHGVHPTVSSNAAANETPPPYVVGFEPPLVLPEAQTQGLDQQGTGTGTGDNDDGRSSGSGGNTGGEILLLGAGAGEQERSGAVHKRDVDGLGRTARLQKQKHQQPREKSPQREFKLRWMPLSLTSRTNAAALREVEEGDDGHRDGNEHEPDAGRAWPHGFAPSGPWSGGSVKEEMDGDGTRQRAHRALWLDDSESDDAENAALDIDLDVDYARGPYSDMAAAARLSIPFRPVVPSLSLVSVSDMGSGIGLLGATSSSSSSSNGSSSSSSNGSSRSSFFAHSSTSTSISTSPPSVFERRKSSISELDAAASSVEFGEERNSYMEVGSHPYHPSQFRGLPGPAPTNAVVPPRSYMVV